MSNRDVLRLATEILDASAEGDTDEVERCAHQIIDLMEEAGERGGILEKLMHKFVEKEWHSDPRTVALQLELSEHKQKLSAIKDAEKELDQVMDAFSRGDATAADVKDVVDRLDGAGPQKRGVH